MASEEEAAEYLEKHQILKLMENLVSLLLFHRPEKPKLFLSEHLQMLKRSQLSQLRAPTLFTSSDLDTVFQLLDPAHRKYITYDQYKYALQTLGVSDINECPDGVNDEKISHDTFKTEAMEGLQRSARTFHSP
ncbi:unnamed protein product [Knipowitschia caucasica]|uniref:EF-hand domain-containing protein n=1 Tax=Knipowitschia caucasica TaxID=637954 RepID=A0AAV2L3K0_KNICA